MFSGQRTPGLYAQSSGRCGIHLFPPGGSLLYHGRYSGSGWNDDREFARYPVTEIGVAVVPGKREVAKTATSLSAKVVLIQSIITTLF